MSRVRWLGALSCKTDVDCPKGLHCQGGTCASPVATTEWAQGCKSDAECAEGEKCTNTGACAKPTPPTPKKSSGALLALIVVGVVGAAWWATTGVKR